MYTGTCTHFTSTCYRLYLIIIRFLIFTAPNAKFPDFDSAQERYRKLMNRITPEMWHVLYISFANSAILQQEILHLVDDGYVRVNAITVLYSSPL